MQGDDLMSNCKNCNCDCHCSKKEHGDVYGACTCVNCGCNKEDTTVVDDTGECEACQWKNYI